MGPSHKVAGPSKAPPVKGLNVKGQAEEELMIFITQLVDQIQWNCGHIKVNGSV